MVAQTLAVVFTALRGAWQKLSGTLGLSRTSWTMSRARLSRQAVGAVLANGGGAAGLVKAVRELTSTRYKESFYGRRDNADA
jgi:hypothetical protein